VRGRLAAALLACAALPALALEVQDDRGHTVRLQGPAQRIVSLLPSLTETVCELGACDRLLGVDAYSDWPPQVRALPRVGDVNGASIERIVALQPDLVLLSSSSRAIERLQALGIPVLGLELKTLGDVRRTLFKVGDVLGVAGADSAWARIEAGLAQAAQRIPPERRGISVYFEIASGPYAASASSHIGDMLARLHAVNIVPGHLGSVPQVSPEFVVRRDPQLVMAPAHNALALVDRPGWRRIRAVREGRVCAFTPAQADVIVRPGPRLAQAAGLLADCIAGHAGGGR
jgi:iron complex transport system substrate-binding protein